MSVSGADREQALAQNGRSQTLYRFFDQEGRLLYVGITLAPLMRFRDHRQRKEWWSSVARIALEHFGSRRAVIRAERIAISEEAPLHNIQLNGSDLAVVDLSRRRRTKADAERFEGWTFCPTCGTRLYPLGIPGLLGCCRDHVWKPTGC